MKKLLIILAIALIGVVGALTLFSTSDVPYQPSDLSDLIAHPDSPLIITDISALEGSVIIDKDQPVIVRDGTRLSANVFRPKAAGRYPVVMAITAYHKDEGPKRYPDYLRTSLEPAFDLGPITVSPWTPWEAPDPAYWVQQGYVVVTLDSRGFGKSEGKASLFSIQDREDFHDAITWAGTQDWSNGNVGLNGVSYLAIAQWAAASKAPSHLKAIIPWEGQSDSFREVLFHGGIPETAFTTFWRSRIRAKSNAVRLPPEWLMDYAGARPLLMKWLQQRSFPSGIALGSITVPALICGTWSDHGMHTRGSFEAFKAISSKQKWLYTHGRSKWTVYNSPEALAVQTAFFDHFLKGEDNGFEKRSRVRLEIRETRDQFTVRSADTWPLSNTQYTALYLDATTKSLRPTKPQIAASQTYEAKTGSAKFRITFDQDTELTGNMKLKLWVEAEGNDDMDLFVATRKFDADGEEVTFFGKAGYRHHPVALGWLRASLRGLDRDRSTPQQPVQAFDEDLPLSSGDIVPVEVEILPSSTLFRAGETLEVHIQGFDHVRHRGMAHNNTVNQGIHIIHTGGSYDSHLLVPVIPQSSAQLAGRKVD